MAEPARTFVKKLLCPEAKAQPQAKHSRQSSMKNVLNTPYTVCGDAKKKTKLNTPVYTDLNCLVTLFEKLRASQRSQ